MFGLLVVAWGFVGMLCMFSAAWDLTLWVSDPCPDWYQGYVAACCGWQDGEDDTLLVVRVRCPERVMGPLGWVAQDEAPTVIVPVTGGWFDISEGGHGNYRVAVA